MNWYWKKGKNVVCYFPISLQFSIRLRFLFAIQTFIKNCIWPRNYQLWLKFIIRTTANILLYFSKRLVSLLYLLCLEIVQFAFLNSKILLWNYQNYLRWISPVWQKSKFIVLYCSGITCPVQEELHMSSISFIFHSACIYKRSFLRPADLMSSGFELNQVANLAW